MYCMVHTCTVHVYVPLIFSRIIMDKLVATVKRKRQELDERVALDALEGLKVGAVLTSWEASGVARLSDSPSLAVTFSHLPPKKRPVVVNYHVIKILMRDTPVE